MLVVIQFRQKKKVYWISWYIYGYVWLSWFDKCHCASDFSWLSPTECVQGSWLCCPYWIYQYPLIGCIIMLWVGLKRFLHIRLRGLLSETNCHQCGVDLWVPTRFSFIPRYTIQSFWENYLWLWNGMSSICWSYPALSFYSQIARWCARGLEPLPDWISWNWILTRQR